MATLHLQAGQKAKILSKFSNSMTMTYRFSASPVADNAAPSGTVEVKGSNWIFPGSTTTQPLEAHNSVTKSMWNVFFSVHVTPDQDLEIELEGGQMKAPLVIAVLVGGIILAAVILMFAGAG